MTRTIRTKKRSRQMVNIFAFGNGNRTKAIFGNPLAEIAKKIPITGIFSQHIGFARIFNGLAQIHTLFLRISPGHFRKHMTPRAHRLTSVFHLQFPIRRNHNSIGFEIEQIVKLGQDRSRCTNRCYMLLGAFSQARKAVASTDNLCLFESEKIFEMRKTATETQNTNFELIHT